MDFLHRYEAVSGQLISQAKSSFYIGKPAPASCRTIVYSVTGFQRRQLPFIYLGCPIFTGCLKISYFDDMVRKVREMISGWANRLLTFGGKLILIRHVLSALPLHLFHVLHPPSTVIQSLERLFTRFLWSDSEGRRRIHWCRWPAVCFPVDEGGLDIRSFDDMAEAFEIKLWWRFRQQSSLWASFMKSKESVVSGTITGWALAPYIFLTLQRLPRSIVEQILLVPISSEEPDLIRWDLSPDGTFHLQTAWELVRCTRPRDEVYSIIWQRHIPSRVSFFLWRLLHGFLATDDALCLRGFHMVSRCVCGREAETLGHHFLDCPRTRYICGHYQRILGMRELGFLSPRALPPIWRRRAPSRNHLWVLMPCFILWQVWKARNAYRFHSQSFLTDAVIFQEADSISCLDETISWSGHSVLEVESDSATMVSWVHSQGPVRWDYSYLLRRACHLISSASIQVRHVLREATSAADFLANWACSHRSSRQFSSPQELPRDLSGIIHTDAQSITYVRR
ncbi:zf-RVT domain-containing protein [Citrus sinensis]|uniref:Zf-RVT domain-containing protein n=1 Tax=Citrus sinensis TaxID=2711 RepID=A0ACB8K673_CITSI|nr:zf-RVT domain-containing protein [Citrus sinensis]